MLAPVLIQAHFKNSSAASMKPPSAICVTTSQRNMPTLTLTVSIFASSFVSTSRRSAFVVRVPATI
ncbi:hypothetical protein A8B73_03515 [Methylosinus sp. 3S-1]|nr:hypothetical protein A8B73_03515 [Methylosinus sp. 3S-1]